MSEIANEILDETPASTGDSPIRQNPLNMSDWEKRVSEARLQREKVLLKRATKPSAQSFKPLKPFRETTDVDELTNADLNAMHTDHGFSNQECIGEATQENLNWSHETPEEHLSGNIQNPVVSEEVEGKARFLSWIPGVFKSSGNEKPFSLLACSAVFGFGFGLGIGVIVAVGWSLFPEETLNAELIEPVLPTPEFQTASQGAQTVSVVQTLNSNDLGAGEPNLPIPQNNYEATPVLDLPIIEPVYHIPMSNQDNSDVMRSLVSMTVPETDDLVLSGDLVSSSVSEPKPSFFVHAPESVTDQAMNAYIAQLEDLGYPISRIGRESFRVSATHLRYYSPDSAEIAQSVAASLGVKSRDFSQDSNNSSRIEVWLAGTSLEALKTEEVEKEEVDDITNILSEIGVAQAVE